MTTPTKIDFQHRRIRQIGDVTDLVAIFFPGNRNQQYAAGRILLALKEADTPQRSLSQIEKQHGISRRTLQRNRAKLARLGLIEHVSWMNSRHGGCEGWMLSSRMSTSLRLLAEWMDRWRHDVDANQCRKDEQLVGLMREDHDSGGKKEGGFVSRTSGL